MGPFCVVVMPNLVSECVVLSPRATMGGRIVLRASRVRVWIRAADRLFAPAAIGTLTRRFSSWAVAGVSYRRLHTGCGAAW